MANKLILQHLESNYKFSVGQIRKFFNENYNFNDYEQLTNGKDEQESKILLNKLQLKLKTYQTDLAAKYDELDEKHNEIVENSTKKINDLEKQLNNKVTDELTSEYEREAATMEALLDTSSSQKHEREHNAKILNDIINRLQRIQQNGSIEHSTTESTATINNGSTTETKIAPPKFKLTCSSEGDTNSNDTYLPLNIAGWERLTDLVARNVQQYIQKQKLQYAWFNIGQNQKNIMNTFINIFDKINEWEPEYQKLVEFMCHDAETLAKEYIGRKNIDKKHYYKVFNDFQVLQNIIFTIDQHIDEEITKNATFTKRNKSNTCQGNDIYAIDIEVKKLKEDLINKIQQKPEFKGTLFNLTGGIIRYVSYKNKFANVSENMLIKNLRETMSFNAVIPPYYQHAQDQLQQYTRLINRLDQTCFAVNSLAQYYILKQMFETEINNHPDLANDLREHATTIETAERTWKHVKSSAEETIDDAQRKYEKTISDHLKTQITNGKGKPGNPPKASNIIGGQITAPIEDKTEKCKICTQTKRKNTHSTKVCFYNPYFEKFNNKWEVIKDAHLGKLSLNQGCWTKRNGKWKPKRNNSSTDTQTQD